MALFGRGSGKAVAGRIVHAVCFMLYATGGTRPVTQPGVTPRCEAFFGRRKTTNLCSESALCPAWLDAWRILRRARGTPESEKTEGVGHPSVLWRAPRRRAGHRQRSRWMGSKSNCMWRLKLITGPPPLLPDGPQPMLLQTPSPTVLDRHRVLCCVLRATPPRRCCCPDTCSGVC